MCDLCDWGFNGETFPPVLRDSYSYQKRLIMGSICNRERIIITALVQLNFVQVEKRLSPGRGEVVDLCATRKSSFFGGRTVNLRATRKFTGQ